MISSSVSSGHTQQEIVELSKLWRMLSSMHTN
jgi:hypothetical protein